MEVTASRHIQSGEEYDGLFPKSAKEVTVIKRDAKLEDTLKFLPKAIRQTLYQTKQIAQQFAGSDPYQTCKEIWQFVYDHIRYRKDEDGKEQIQSPQYTWAVRAGDCDDYTVLIASILCNLNFKVCLRVSMYKEENGYQHIYPLVILPDNSTIIMDCVAERFDYEVPYIKKIDKIMELQFLNGLPIRPANQNIDADDLLKGEDMGELGKRGRLKAKLKNFSKKAKAGFQKVKNSKFVKAVKKGIHAINKVNPATALLRAGVLIAMKTNVLKIAESLRFAYLSEDQARQKGFDKNKWQRLVGVKNRLEKIFHGAGGEQKNLKKAILTGKGNRSKEVPLSGLGAIDLNDYNDNHTLQQILGIETYNSEIGQVEGLGSLGVVAATAVASAMTVLTAIVGAIKSIGSLKKKKEGGNDSGGGNDSSGDNGGSSDNSGGSNDNSSSQNNSDTNTTADNGDNSSADSNSGNSNGASRSRTRQQDGGGGGENSGSNADTPASTNDTDSGSGSSTDSNGSGSKTESTGQTSTDPENTSDSGDGNEKPAFNAKGVATNPQVLTGFAKLTNWVKENPLPAAGIGIVVIGGIAYGLHLMFKPKKKDKGLSGLQRKKHHHHAMASTKLKIFKLK